MSTPTFEWIKANWRSPKGTFHGYRCLTITPAEAVQELNAMVHDYDVEISHGMADAILVRLLKDASPELQEVALAWERAKARVGFWYA
jgi:hypothetical protein